MKLCCFICFQDFLTTIISSKCRSCGWYVCPECRSCLCHLTAGEKAVAIAVWLGYVELPEEERKKWTDMARHWGRIWR